MNMRLSAIAALAGIAVAVVGAQSRGLDPAELLRPLGEQWSSYSGDYTGRRYSSLTQVDQNTVKSLSLAWTVRLTGGAPAGGPGGGPGGPGGAPGTPPVTVGGEGSGDVVVGGNVTLKGAILAVNGILYVTAPDNVWALDAHDGHTLWRYFWKTKGGTHIGNRGAAMWN